MSDPQRILVIEIKTIDNPGLDSSQISTMQFREEHNIYCLAFDRDKVELAVVDGIFNLDNNYRHPLYFHVQPLPDNGKNVDNCEQTVDMSSARRRRRRRRKANS